MYPVQPPPFSSSPPGTSAPPSVHPAYGSVYPNAHAGYRAPAEPRRTSPVVWVLAAMGLMAVLGGVLGTSGLAVLGATSEHEQGVVLGAQVPQDTVDALRSRRLLGPGEELLAYHDATVSLDMSLLTFVTATRVVHARGATVASMELAQVRSVRHHTEGLVGDVIEVVSDDGRTMRIEIAPLNGGASYVNVLEEAWRRVRPGAKVVRASH